MADIPDPYAPGNHGAYLYTYAKKVDLVPLPVSNITQCLNYAGLPRAIATAGAEEEEEFYYGNSLTNNGTYGTKTATGNSRIFNCKHCQRAFTREEHLTRHILLTHNKLKPYVCGICTRPFSRRDLLLRHAKNLHDGSEVAVLRIRKLYKKLEKDDSELGSGGSDQLHGDLQKMKMSVNMLVS
ncbi:hypothetical protein PUMCH_001613 [Australozyma saopauloensis]|uniref:C2H2-type domain-containing protein n=1 Tax=Australozyma saopauloensis TaxID=291208 RepID=A0AAX4H785_9ASCO|nr:hypothetical protein PUMCH_001613 [[Candida] saopauloensis]